MGNVDVEKGKSLTNMGHAQIYAAMEQALSMEDAKLVVEEEKSGRAITVYANQISKEYLLVSVLHNAEEMKWERNLTANALKGIKGMGKMCVFLFQTTALPLTAW